MNAVKNVSTPHIRLATVNDIDAIFVIRTSVKENHLSREQLTRMGITHGAISEAIRSSPCVWIAQVGENLAGFSMADINEGSVFAMFLLPEFEGLGIGRLLMEKVEETLFRHHSAIWLETGRKSRAHGFYQRLGWQVTRELEEGDVRMEKSRPEVNS